MYRPSSLVLVSLAVVGCSSDAPKPSEVRTRIANDLVAVLDGAKAATADGAALPDTTRFALLEGVLGRPLDTMLSSESELALQVRPKLSRIAETLAPARVSGSRLPVDGDATEGYDGAEAAQWLNDNIFTDANHAGDGVYEVPAALVCTETQYDDQGNPIGEAVDPECAQSFAKLQLRLRVSEDDDALRIALQLGPDHDEPLAVALSSTLLSLTIDLDETEDAVKALAPTFGEAAPNVALAGAVTAKLELTAPQAATISLAIDRDVSIEVADAGESLDGPNALRISSKKTTIFAMALDGTLQRMQLGVDLRATTAHVPDEIDGALELDLPGISGHAEYRAGQPLVVTGLGLGDRTTTVKVGGQTAVALDLNKNHGRTLDATLDGDLLTVSPQLDFEAQIDRAVLGDAPPVYDVTRVFVTGSLRGRLDGIEVVTGTFGIATNPTGYGFVADAGECVSSTTQLDGNGEPYEQFTVGACN